MESQESLTIYLSDRYTCDQKGVWWYHDGSGKRNRCQLYTCFVCKKIFPRMPCEAKRVSPDRRTCSKKCGRRGPNSHNFTCGGRRKWTSGYVVIYRPSHPRADKKGFVLEHIVVVEEKIGRFLQKGETVHHKGAKDDNRPEMLELWSTSHPPGHRVEEKLAWAREILRKYAPHKLKETAVETPNSRQSSSHRSQSEEKGGGNARPTPDSKNLQDQSEGK